MPDYKKALIGKEDLSLDTDRNNSSFNRETSTGGSQSITKLNAKHIPVTNALSWNGAENIEEFLTEAKAHYDAYVGFIGNVGFWDNYLGPFADSATLIATHAAPTSDNVFAWVNDTKSFWHWDESAGTPEWADSYRSLSYETAPTLGGPLDTDGNYVDFGNDSGIRNLFTLGFTASSEKTIASGSITATSIMHSVDTESDAAEDYLTTIIPASNSSFIVLKQEDSSRTVIAQHATGSNKIVLPNSKDLVFKPNALYMFFHDGTSWNLVFSSASDVVEGTLIDEATISWDVRAKPRATVTLADNRTLDTPTNMEAGGFYMLRVVQDATGSRTLDFNPIYYTPASINLEANAVTVLYFYSDGSNMYGNAVDPDTWVRLSSGSYTGVNAFDLSTAGSTQTEAVAGETAHTGIFFSQDGSKIFLTGEGTDAVREFDLSTAFDVSTISAVQVTMSTTSETSNPQSVCFTSDGLKMYVGKESTATIFQYTLSTAWDLSTASYTASYAVSTDMASSLRDLSIKPDGSKIYALEVNGDVYEWDLTSGDITTASFVQSFNPTEATSSNHGLAMSSDGTKMLIAANSNGSFYEYSLSTPFDISTASYTSENITMNCSGLTFSSDGFRVASCSGGNIYDKPLGTQNVSVAADKNYIITEALSQHTLPESPQDGTTIRLRRFLSGSSHPTAVTQGSDTFDDASSELSLDTDRETTELIYNDTTTEWEVY